MKVLSFGEILWDIIDGEPHLGGAPLNFAAHILQNGLFSGILSCLGNDKWGIQAIDAIQKVGLDTRLILRRNKRTGLVEVKISDGQPDYEILENVAYDYIDVGRLPHSLINDYDYFYFGTLAQRSTSSRESLYEVLNNHTFKEVFYDVNLRKNSYSAETINQSLKHCSIFKINDEEVPVVSKLIFNEDHSILEFSERVSKQYPIIHTVIITAGSKGCFIYADSKLVEVPGVEVIVKDTVGAGDSFSAAYLASYIKSGDKQKAATIANQVGAYVAAHKGAIPKYSQKIKSLIDS